MESGNLPAWKQSGCRVLFYLKLSFLFEFDVGGLGFEFCVLWNNVMIIINHKRPPTCLHPATLSCLGSGFSRLGSLSQRLASYRDPWCPTCSRVWGWPPQSGPGVLWAATPECSVWAGPAGRPVPCLLCRPCYSSLQLPPPPPCDTFFAAVTDPTDRSLGARAREGGWFASYRKRPLTLDSI